ncbi:hypothetical protein CBW24_06240 [Pacificitalea manganoxidans]|uniref:DUF3168 domain-containing protein n=1 Tax=Pacificitalea manganoxidans TaxID=1411902 RepID=A0A291LYC2_9RHOB|nr:DUF3168 domain-containing protein [Pacificitalea manganoxidans]ATI41637.1 hypothetical protein CBW24_06240 [Pacificitalea manganoxidans]MDR6309079.1 hypothetical protein [Pacificitalea manganoxidans]
MSYAVTGALQAAVYQVLVTDPALTDLIGGAVHDALPDPGAALPPVYVLLGAEEARARDDATAQGALIRFTLSVMGGPEGFAQVKAAAAAVCDALEPGLPPLARGRVISLRFERARAVRTGTQGGRRIDLRFAARVED